MHKFSLKILLVAILIIKSTDSKGQDVPTKHMFPPSDIEQKSTCKSFDTIRNQIKTSISIIGLLQQKIDLLEDRINQTVYEFKFDKRLLKLRNNCANDRILKQALKSQLEIIKLLETKITLISKGQNTSDNQ